MEPNCRWKHSFAESRQCYLFSLFPRVQVPGKTGMVLSVQFLLCRHYKDGKKSNFEKPFESCQMKTRIVRKKTWALLKKGLGLPMFVYK